MGLRPHETPTVDSGECIQCMACLETCPRRNISVQFADRPVRPLAASIAVVLALALSSFALPAFVETANGLDASLPAATGAVPTSAGPAASGYADGTYSGSGTGYRNRTTKVSVTIEGGRIASIATVSTGDDRKWYQRAFSAMVSRILGAQSTDVDTVGGATYSSRGIRSAVADALSKASVA
jgi:uncharacterized protein with FMN-binding domain